MPADRTQFTRSSASRIAKATRRVERLPTDLTGDAGRRKGRPQVETIFARLTDVDEDGLYSWEEVEPQDDDTWVAVGDDDNPGRGGSPDDSPARPLAGQSYYADAEEGQVVLLRRRAVRQTDEDAEADHEPGWTIVSPNSGLFRVRVSEPDGDAGDPEGNCTFTYDLSYPDGTPIDGATGLTPDVPRYENCEYVPPDDGSPGIAYYDLDGGLHLLWAVQERPKGDVATNLTAVRWNSTTGEFEGKTRDELVLEMSDETESTPLTAEYHDCES